LYDHGAHVGRTFYAGLLEALTRVMGSAKGYLYDHAPRAAHLCRQLAPHIGLDRRQTSELIFASVLSDLGMIGLAEDAWENPRPVLEPDVRARVNRHPVRSERAVAGIPHLEGVASLVRHHHEWWNGGGYPDALAGESIPLGARVLRLADTVCALGEPRPQRPILPPERILSIVEDASGSEFAPDVAAEYLRLATAGQLAAFDRQAYQRSLRQAAERLLPPEVSPLSADHLLDILANLIDAKDPYTGGHSRRVAILAVAVSSQLGLDERFRATIWAAGYLHDLGKLAVPLRVMAKNGPLNDTEWLEIQSHTRLGADILQTVWSLRHLATGARYHHEKWDGSGYPEGLSGQNIPMVAQILAVCDAYDAMTSTRAYRSGLAHESAMAEIARCAGKHFGPAVAAAFLSLPDHLFQSVRQAPSPGSDFFPAGVLGADGPDRLRLRSSAG
jgi:HD-GYP domain-containing protein (c-di-GMP phosphodiesterase class II)